MWEEEVFPRALQNHFEQLRQRTTVLGLWIPQYLQVTEISMGSCFQSGHLFGITYAQA